MAYRCIFRFLYSKWLKHKTLKPSYFHVCSELDRSSIVKICCYHFECFIGIGIRIHRLFKHIGTSEILRYHRQSIFELQASSNKNTKYFVYKSHARVIFIDSKMKWKKRTIVLLIFSLLLKFLLASLWMRCRTFETTFFLQNDLPVIVKKSLRCCVFLSKLK